VVEDENNYSGRLTYNWAEANKIKDSIFHVGIAGFSEDYSVRPKTSVMELVQTQLVNNIYSCFSC
jgi:phosphate-selective porin OprO/OprP